MNTVKNYTTIHFRLNWINVSEVKIFLMTYQIKQKIQIYNLYVFNMITGKNESKILTKDISCECKCKFDGRKCILDQWWNSNKC